MKTNSYRKFSVTKFWVAGHGLLFGLSILMFGGAPDITAQTARGNTLLELTRDAHRGARESLRTCSCRVKLTGAATSAQPESSPFVPCSGRFWYSPEAVKAQVAQRGREVEYVWKDSVRLGLSHGAPDRKLPAAASRTRSLNRYVPRCDAFVRGLLVLNVPGSVDCVPFEELLTQATRVNDVQRRVLDGKEMIVIRLLFERTKERDSSWDVEIHFDPSVNYLVRKTVYISEGGYRREDEVIQFKECVPGIFFPEKIVGQSGPGGKIELNHSTAITDILVNQPLPENTFRLTFPHGTYLMDSIRGAGRTHQILPELLRQA